MLEQQIDIFLKELDEVTGNIIEMKMLKHDENIIVLIIYSCWKKL